METKEFLDYLVQHESTAKLAESLRDLIARRRDRAEQRQLARRGGLVPIPLPVDPRPRPRAAS